MFHGGAIGPGTRKKSRTFLHAQELVDAVVQLQPDVAADGNRHDGDLQVAARPE